MKLSQGADLVLRHLIYTVRVKLREKQYKIKIITPRAHGVIAHTLILTHTYTRGRKGEAKKVENGGTMRRGRVSTLDLKGEGEGNKKQATLGVNCRSGRSFYNNQTAGKKKGKESQSRTVSKKGARTTKRNRGVGGIAGHWVNTGVARLMVFFVVLRCKRCCCGCNSECWPLRSAAAAAVIIAASVASAAATVLSLSFSHSHSQ